MKNYAFLLLLLLFSSEFSYTQIYYDAVKLRSYIPAGQNKFANNTTTSQEIAAILRNYSSDPVKTNSASTIATVMHEFDNNLFLKPYIPGGFYAGGAAGFSSALSSLGNLDVTAFADALAQFLVERTKEELNEAFFRKFADFLNYYPEFKTLFPNTNVFVNNFNSWEYANLLNTLREAFDKDIKELLSNLVKLKDLDASACFAKGESSCTKNLCDSCQKRIVALNTFLSSNPGILLLSSVEVGNGLLAGQKIPDIINSIDQKNFLLSYQGSDANETENIHNAIQLVDILSYSFRSNLTGKHYISADEFKQLLTDPILQDLYLGLLYQKISNQNIQFINGGTTITVTDYITPTNKNNLIAYIANFSEQAKNLETTVNKLTEDKTDGKNDLGADYGALFQASQQILQAATNVSVINTNLQLPSTITDVLNTTSKVIQIAHDISVRNYNAVVIGTLKLLSDEIETLKNTDPNKALLQEFAAAFLKYGSFAANVVLSKDPDEVKQAINSFALPAGSSSIKKHTQFNISVNAYTGFVYGFKNHPFQSSYTTKSANGSDSTVKLNGGQSIAVFAPVGIGFNWGLGWKQKNPWSISAFVSLIDVGAIVGYRFITDTGEISTKFKVSLSNILAPGVNAIIGLPNMPLSIGAGAQYIPSLQRDPASNEFYNIDHSGIRYQVFAAVDLPLLNLHTSKKNLLLVKH